jgi:hypothetical protein
MNKHKVSVIIKSKKIKLDNISILNIKSLVNIDKDIHHRITLPIELVVKRIELLQFRDGMKENEEQIIQLPRKPNSKLDIKSTIRNDSVKEESSTKEVMPNKISNENCVKCYII